MPGTHAWASPSNFGRMIACSPSARLCQKWADMFGEDSSPFAAEGTKAHSLSELKLRKELGKDDANGINEYNYNAQREQLGEIPEEMDRYTDDYVDTVLSEYYSQKRICPDARLFIEQRVDLSRWVKGSFGSSDAIVVSDAGLIVMDLKYGKGVEVSAVGNPQARAYALGALDAYESLYNFNMVKVMIIQPRMNGVSEETISKDELLRWADEVLKPAAEKAYEGTGELTPGPHCRFCKVKAICRARVVDSLDTAINMLDSPDLISDEKIAELLPHLDQMEDWISSVKAYANNRAKQGAEFKGYKLVKGRRPGRVWTDDDAVIDRLAIAGYGSDQYFATPKLRSVSEMEKLLGKSAFKALLGELTYQGEGSLTLVPESDKREAYTGIDLSFGDLGEINIKEKEEI